MMKKKKELALEREEKVKGERGEEGEKDRKRGEKEKPTVRSGPRYSPRTFLSQDQVIDIDAFRKVLSHSEFLLTSSAIPFGGLKRGFIKC